jgi:DNA-directed RNA polymerase specialized sigma24 family protein
MSALNQIQTEFSPHIPDLMKYGERLCGSRAAAERLVAGTLETAHQKRWKKASHVPVDAWLSMLMMQHFMAGQS